MLLLHHIARASWWNRTAVSRLQIMCNNRYTNKAKLATVSMHISYWSDRSGGLPPQDFFRLVAKVRNLTYESSLGYRTYIQIIADLQYLRLPSRILNSFFSCGGRNRTCVIQLMRLSWNRLQSTPRYSWGTGIRTQTLRTKIWCATITLCPNHTILFDWHFS